MTVSRTDFPAGFENFEELRNQGKIYIDKTFYLRDLLTGAVVTLLLRPRRFGKTLSMSMLEKFVQINYSNPEDRSRQEKLFEDLAVYEEKYSETDYTVSKDFIRDINRKISDFRLKTGTKYGIHATLVTCCGVRQNAYAGELQAVITAEDLFR